MLQSVLLLLDVCVSSQPELLGLPSYFSKPGTAVLLASILVPLHLVTACHMMPSYSKPQRTANGFAAEGVDCTHALNDMQFVAVAAGIATPQSSPARQLRTLSSHPLPPSTGDSQSPYWWDAPDTTVWPEEDARSKPECAPTIHLLTICSPRLCMQPSCT